MKCNKCNKEIPDYSRFCLHCGAKIEVLEGIMCECGYKNFLDARYCTECGRKLKITYSPQVELNGNVVEITRNILQLQCDFTSETPDIYYSPQILYDTLMTIRGKYRGEISNTNAKEFEKQVTLIYQKSGYLGCRSKRFFHSRQQVLNYIKNVTHSTFTEGNSLAYAGIELFWLEGRLKDDFSVSFQFETSMSIKKVIDTIYDNCKIPFTY